jgi:hypothetical protein
MKDLFTKFHENEKNENTALILMLGVLSEKLTEISLEIEKSNKLLKEIVSCVKKEETPTKEIIILQSLSKEDYME